MPVRKMRRMLRPSRIHGTLSRARRFEWRMVRTSACMLMMMRSFKTQMVTLLDFLDLFPSLCFHILVSCDDIT